MPNYFQIGPKVFNKNIPSIYTYISKMALFPGGHVFQRMNIIWAILVEGHPRTMCANFFQIGPVVSDKIFFFLLVNMTTRVLHVTATRILHGMELFE